MDRAKRSVECPPRSPNLRPLNFYLWDDLKNTVSYRKPRILQGLRHRTEIASLAVPPTTMRKVCPFVASYQQ
jgi:hypothetical protein